MTPALRSDAGPIVWAGIVVVTLTLLIALQQTLWLVVPCLLALVLYYALYPSVQALVFRGLSHNRAAALVTLVLGVAVALLGVRLLPGMAAHLLDWQSVAERYIAGGIHLLDSTLRMAESVLPVLARAELADSVAARLQGTGNRLAEYLEPVALGILAWAPSLLLAPFLAFFFLRDGHRFKRFLGQAVPNAFFERTLFLLNEVDRTARAYFTGLIQLTVLDTLTLAAGLWFLGIPGAGVLAALCAVLAWVPYVGSILGGLLVILVAATDFPATPTVAYGAAALFVAVRLLDDFVYMPLTIGKSLHMHPVMTVLMIFAGGAVAGIPGLMLVLPLLGVVRVVGETVGHVLADARLLARHRHAQRLRRQMAAVDLQ